MIGGDSRSLRTAIFSDQPPLKSDGPMKTDSEP
jgi:hypothetical protein